MSGLFNLDQCNISQIIGESSRYLFHIFLLHIISALIDKNKVMFGEELFKNLLITATAIALYHVVFRKFVEPKIEKLKLICYHKNTRDEKRNKLNLKASDSKLRSKTNGSKKLSEYKSKYVVFEEEEMY
jgi:hypothetical protein